MKTIHNITVKVFAKPEEEKDTIKETFVKLFPFNLEENKISLGETHAKGFEERKITIYEVVLEKNALIKAFIDDLLKKLSKEQKELLIEQKESRLDEELNFFMRLDKTKLYSGEYFITDSGECFHLKIKVAAFPANKETGLKVIDELFR